jgi:hypothetical protein
LDEETAVTQDLAFEKDLDLNEINFNLIRNSNAFRPKPGFIEEEEVKTGFSSLFDPKRRSEEDNNRWLFN